MPGNTGDKGTDSRASNHRVKWEQRQLQVADLGEGTGEEKDSEPVCTIPFSLPMFTWYIFPNINSLACVIILHNTWRPFREWVSGVFKCLKLPLPEVILKQQVPLQAQQDGAHLHFQLLGGVGRKSRSSRPSSEHTELKATGSESLSPVTERRKGTWGS